MMARPTVLGGRLGAGPDSAMSWGGKLSMMPSPSKGALKGLTIQKRSPSASQIAAADVRALGNDEQIPADQEPNSNSNNNSKNSEHNNLMMRLKSREARAKAESNRDFLTRYRASHEPDPKADDWLDKLLKNTTSRAEELKLKSEELQIEAADAERKLERATSQTVNRANEGDLQAMNAFERSQRRIQEDKREEELQKLRDEAQANYVRVHRRLQNELLELRDYQVLLVEFRRLRLEKLQETLGRVEDGRRLRSCVREMLRHGAQRILGRLETAGVALETWMREVLVNSCHLELRIEDAEAKLLKFQRHALGPVKTEVQDMVGASKQERFENLCARTWDNRRRGVGSDEPVLARETTIKFATQEGEEPGDSHPNMSQTMASGPNAGFRGVQSMSSTKQSSTAVSRVPESVAAEMHAVEADIDAVKRLLSDMRANSAAVICQQIREAEKTGGRGAGKEAMEDGFRLLKLMVNEDFAKTTVKELQKSAPQGKFGF